MTNGMDRWKFNTTLFSSLSDVLDITGTEIARRCGLRQQVLSRYTTNEIVVSVQILIKLCNSLRMPVYYFVAENNNFVILIVRTLPSHSTTGILSSGTHKLLSRLSATVKGASTGKTWPWLWKPAHRNPTSVSPCADVLR